LKTNGLWFLASEARHPLYPDETCETSKHTIKDKTDSAQIGMPVPVRFIIERLAPDMTQKEFIFCT